MASSALPLIGFSLCSSSLLVLNKLCLTHAALPSVLATFQFIVVTAAVAVLMATGQTQVELSASRVRAYISYIAVFSGAIYTNMKSLSHYSVETIIVVRSCCPLLVAVLERNMLGHALPAPRSAVALFALFGCAVGYAYSESLASGKSLLGSATATFAPAWLLAYYILICTSDSYGKRIVSLIRWQSLWGPVLYSNALSIPPMLATAAFGGELQQVHAGAALREGSSWRAALVPLSLSCLAAVGISFFGWRCRDICSATGFTLLGVANKLLSTLASALLTGQPLSHAGGMCLVGCLFFAAQYRPAPPVAAVEERDRKTKQG